MRQAAAAAQTVSPDGFVVLEASVGRLPISSAPTEVWGFAGMIPGPRVRIRLGDEVKVRLVNRLATPLSIHWQGVSIANAMDGVGGLTQVPVPPGGSFDYRFRPPDSGTFLFRPVVPGNQPGPPGSGLCGVLEVAEPAPPAVDHGLYILATSWRLDAAGRAVDPERAGKTILGSGASTQVHSISLPQGARVRLRTINGSVATPMLLAIDGARPSVIAVDSQPCEPFAPAHGIIPIGPGARFDLILDLPRNPGAEVRAVLRDALNPDDTGRPVLVMRTGTGSAPEHPMPLVLPENPRLPTAIALERAARARLVLRPGAAVGAASPEKMEGRVLSASLAVSGPALSVRRGTPVAFALVNPDLRPMSVHVHGHALRILHDLDDGWHPYWRDTVLMEPRKTHHVAFVADNPGKWLVSAQVLGTSESYYTWFEVG